MILAPPLSPLATLRWSVVQSVLDDLRPRRILELGCGQGGFGARMARYSTYVGVEMDAESAEVARARVEPLGGRVIDSLDGLGADERFDLVCAFEVIEHLVDDVGSLRQWSARLVPGGELLVSVPAWPERFGPWDELAGHQRRYTPEQLETVLAQAGCAELWHTLYGWPLGFAMEAVRMRIAARRLRAVAGESEEARTAASGRLLQPGRAAGLAVRVAVAPFALAQLLRPTVGIGLVATGRPWPRH